MWKALFFNLVNVAVVNAFLLSFHSGRSKNERFDDHLKFREALYKALFAHSDRQELAEPRPAAKEEHIEIPMKRSACVVCKKATQHERGRKRRALKDISPNEGLDRHVRRARVGCKACGVNLCSR